MKNTIPLILLLFCIHLGVGARPSEGKSIVVLHSINFEESWTKQTYLDIENKFGKEGFTVKAIPLQIPGIRTMEGFQEKRKMILEESTCATHLSRMHRRSLLAYHPPVV